MQSIRGMTWDHPRGYAGLEAASAAYARTRSVQVDWDRRSLQAFADRPIADIAASYDLIVIDHPHVGAVAEAGSLLPLPYPPDGDDTSLGGSLESYVWEGRLWAYPVDADCQMAVMRPDLDVAPLPDWETALDARPGDHRLLTPLLPVDAFGMMLTLVASRGEVDLPHAPDRFVSPDNGVAALKVLKALHRLGPADAIAWNPIDVLEILATTDEFAGSPCLFGYINYARPGFRPNVLTFDDLPIFRGAGPARGLLGGAGIGVSAQTQEPELAVDFAAWVTSEPVQSGVYTENEGQPAHVGTWDRLADDPRFAGFLAGGRRAMDHAWTRPRAPWFLGFVDEVCEILPDFFRRDIAAEAFLADIDKLYRHHTREAALA